MTLSTEQQRLVSMLDYLEEWDKLNRSTVFDVAAHQGGFLVWQHDFTGLPGVHSNVADASGEVWLEIERLRPNKPPNPPELLIPWIVLNDDPGTPPRHRESLPNPKDLEDDLLFEDIVELRHAFEAYIEGPWNTWAEAERPRRKSIGLYDRLFNLLQTIETEGAETALELAWGIGVAVWERDGVRVRHPLVTRLVEIDPVSTDMALRVRPREIPPILETDIYVALEIPGLPVFEKAARAILDRPDSHITPFDEASFEQLLAGAAGTLDRQARYWPRQPEYEPGRIPAPTSALTITNTWVLVARRKGTNFLLDDLRRLREAVKSKPLPEGGPTVLVENPVGAVPDRGRRTWRGISSSSMPESDQKSWGPESLMADRPSEEAKKERRTRELYFPKPFNDAQLEIVDRLENADGVVVQGPPGTGKTHTIANVICHYLAEGKSVLVTSKGESALAVLRDHLPPAIRSLSVSLLTNERVGLRQLEQSITKITSEITNLDKSNVRREIERCQIRLDQLHKQIAETDHELADWARKNINPAPPSLDGLPPAELACHVVDAQETFSWFPDALSGGPEHEIRFDHSEIVKLREARKRVQGDLIYLGSTIPSPGALPTAAKIGDLHVSLQHLAEVCEEMEEKKLPRFRKIDEEHLQAASRLRDSMTEAVRIRRSLSDEWTEWLRQQYAAGHGSQSVFQVICEISREMASLVETRRQMLGTAVEWDDEWDEDEELFIAVKSAAAGKSPLWFASIRQKARSTEVSTNHPQRQAPSGC